jgi:hypothetical protein|tara:strand:- start:713 stop:1162 length:450 start_codon:yes stop_codon:yes gene_type:complete
MAVGTSAVCYSFKQEVLVGTHNFTATTGDGFKIALYTNSATISAATTAYDSTATGETTNTAGTAYTAGGASLTSVTPALKSTSTACCDFSDVSWTTASFTARGALIYNDDQGDKAVCVLNFGGDKTASAGTFTIQFPAFDATDAILRLA